MKLEETTIYKANLPLQPNETLDNFRQKMQTALREKFKGRASGPGWAGMDPWPVAVYADKVVWDTGEQKIRHKMVGYKVGSDGSIELVGEPIEVKEVKNFVPAKDDSVVVTKSSNFSGTGFWQGIPIVR